MSSDQLNNLSRSLSLTSSQQAAANDLANRTAALLIAPTGAGKTATLLHAIKQSGRKTIVAAPPQVLSNWHKENIKWGTALSVCVLIGTPAQRKKAMDDKFDVLVVSLQNLSWLLSQPHGCTAIILDEISTACGKFSSKLKNKTADVLTHRIGVTATPVSENFEKLYNMMRVIDSGKTFGTRKESYLNKYFIAEDYRGYRLILRLNAAQDIMDKIAPSVVTLEYSKRDSLPLKTEEIIAFDMSEQERRYYCAMSKNLITHINGAKVKAANLAVLSSKLRQCSSGFMIGVDEVVQEIGNSRAEALHSYLAQVQGKVVVIYEYDYQRRQIEWQLHRGFVSVYGGVDKAAAIHEFTTTNTNVLIAQMRTLSHGVDGLQDVCNTIVFYQPMWSADITEQAIGRIWRQGQQLPVTVAYIVAEDTVDDLVLDRLDGKSVNMKIFMDHIKGQA